MSKEKNFVKIKKSKNTNTIFGLPAKSYTDENFWKKECETVLSNDWLFVGFAHELKNTGDVIPLYIANKPILLVRNNNNEIKAIKLWHPRYSHTMMMSLRRSLPKKEEPNSLDLRRKFGLVRDETRSLTMPC